jgi:hypothetical protein
MTDSELREVYTAADTQEAHLVQMALDAAGIKSRVVGDHLQNAVGDLPAIAISPRIWVRTSDFNQARQIILEHQGDRASAVRDSAPWTCSHCGEDNEPNFDLCWNCQTERPRLEA